MTTETEDSLAQLVERQQKRITELEEQRLELERRVADAFARRDHREGRRAAKQLEQLKTQLDDLYEKWVAESP